MDGTGIGRRSIALVAACVVVLQMVLPFAALAAAPIAGPGIAICSSSGAPSDAPVGHHGCSCAAGCGICCTQIPAVAPNTVWASVARSGQAIELPVPLAFDVGTVRFAPQAARPPPFG
jgi:hypothetical protein